MKPWEETWDSLLPFCGHDTMVDGDEARRRLALAAPEMARLLMHICRRYPGTDGACMVCDQYETQPHTKECSVGKALRKAGVAC